MYFILLFIYLFFIYIYFIVVGFVIHWNVSAMGLHVFPIPIPPPWLYILKALFEAWEWLRVSNELNLNMIFTNIELFFVLGAAV